MKGMVFTELFELVEEKFGYDLLDDVIDASDLSNDGAYTATGNYDFEELLRVVVNLSEQTKIPIPDLLEVYGEHLFPKLVKILPGINSDGSVLEFIATVEDYIHVEVRKLYSDAELPTFELIDKGDDFYEFNYISSRHLEHLAKGMILGAGKFFNENINVNILEVNGNTHIRVEKV